MPISKALTSRPERGISEARLTALADYPELASLSNPHRQRMLYKTYFRQIQPPHWSETLAPAKSSCDPFNGYAKHWPELMILLVGTDRRLVGVVDAWVAKTAVFGGGTKSAWKAQVPTALAEKAVAVFLLFIHIIMVRRAFLYRNERTWLNSNDVNRISSRETLPPLAFKSPFGQSSSYYTSSLDSNSAEESQFLESLFSSFGANTDDNAHQLTKFPKDSQALGSIPTVETQTPSASLSNMNSKRNGKALNVLVQNMINSLSENPRSIAKKSKSHRKGKAHVDHGIEQPFQAFNLENLLESKLQNEENPGSFKFLSGKIYAILDQMAQLVFVKRAIQSRHGNTIMERNGVYVHFIKPIKKSKKRLREDCIFIFPLLTVNGDEIRVIEKAVTLVISSWRHYVDILKNEASEYNENQAILLIDWLYRQIFNPSKGLPVIGWVSEDTTLEASVLETIPQMIYYYLSDTYHTKDEYMKLTSKLVNAYREELRLIEDLALMTRFEHLTEEVNNLESQLRGKAKRIRASQN
ncbi:hypothetical protein O181_004806 [Austropuccinia psidii MF-1]|uniref:Uncharacterized protein n=1 Tax=Austropuccinia psidii MF-1 TaxID=1389203 RepID=A0A9Q3BG92_9BASI|nr:hypothetical protein [Austropuccinia psidii MF-1]